MKKDLYLYYLKYFINNLKINKIKLKNNIIYTDINNINETLIIEDMQINFTHLNFGVEFNQELKEGIIPNSITHLKFGYKFNQKLSEGIIPNSVTHLEFGYSFNQELKEGYTKFCYSPYFWRKI